MAEVYLQKYCKEWNGNVVFEEILWDKSAQGKFLKNF